MRSTMLNGLLMGRFAAHLTCSLHGFPARTSNACDAGEEFERDALYAAKLHEKLSASAYTTVGGLRTCRCGPNDVQRQRQRQQSVAHQPWSTYRRNLADGFFSKPGW
jgi:hypothetical protein